MSSASDTVWRDGRFRPDEWVRRTPDAAPITGDYPLLVALSDLLADPEQFLAHEGPLGVEVPAGESVRALEPYLWKLALIALAFPSFSDGRSYSAARLLRERLNYQGEIRAVGDVLADQIPLMRRCGITSFEVRHGATRAALEAGRLAEMKHFYQPLAAASGEAPAGTRPWLRQPAN
jgi:phosphoadenosine phosphosulfate reductase